MCVCVCVCLSHSERGWWHSEGGNESPERTVLINTPKPVSLMAGPPKPVMDADKAREKGCDGTNVGIAKQGGCGFESCTVFSVKSTLAVCIRSCRTLLCTLLCTTVYVLKPDLSFVTQPLR